MHLISKNRTMQLAFRNVHYVVLCVLADVTALGICSDAKYFRYDRLCQFNMYFSSVKYKVEITCPVCVRESNCNSWIGIHLYKFHTCNSEKVYKSHSF